MFGLKRIWSLTSRPSSSAPPPNARETETPLDQENNEDVYKPRRKRQKQELPASPQSSLSSVSHVERSFQPQGRIRLESERGNNYDHEQERSISSLSSPSFVNDIDTFQQRDIRALYPQSHHRSTTSHRGFQRRRRNLIHAPHQYRCEHHYGNSDLEADFYDDESLTDEEDHQYGRERQHIHMKRSSKSSTRKFAKAGSWKKTNEKYYRRELQQQMDNNSSDESESESESECESESESESICVVVGATDKAKAKSKCESESDSESVVIVDGANTTLKDEPKCITPWSQEVFGRTVQIKESFRNQTGCSRKGTVFDWKNHDTLEVECEGSPRRLLSINLADLDFLPASQASYAKEEEAKPEAKPRAKTQRSRSIQAKETLETKPAAKRIRSKLEQQRQVRETKQDRKVARKPKTVASSRKPAPEPKRKPNQHQEKLLSAPMPTSKISLKKGLFYDSDSSLVDSYALEEQGGLAFDIEVADQGKLEELRIHALWRASKYEDMKVLSDSGKPTCTFFALGQRVRVRDSYCKTYKRGKCGTVIEVGPSTGQNTSFKVKFDNGKCYGFLYSSLEALDGSTMKLPVQPKKARAKTTKKEAPRKANTGKAHSKPRKAKNDSPPAPSAEARQWIAPQNVVATESFWGITNAKIVLPGGSRDEHCFLKHILGRQRMTLEVPLDKNQEVDKAIRLELNGPFGNYEMVSAKTFEEESNYRGRFQQTKRYARVAYAATGSTEDPTNFSIQDSLLRIADFTTLNPRKIAARLELLQSPTRLHITHHEDSLFQEIPDRGYVGGGFIHEDMLSKLLEMAGMGPTDASRAIAIQVRIFIPSMGIFKGVLVKKRRRNGAPIELPWSMKKVMGSTRKDRFPGAYIVINKDKVHPTKGNYHHGKKLEDPSKPPTATLKEKIKKELSKIVFQLWETLGVPKDLCERYKTESVVPDRRNHAWLVGVADPTGSLPPDTIFVPGLNQQGPYDIFVTRMPCTAREDGRKFRAITQKPPGMSTDDWKWLNNMQFGVIIFSNPRPGMMSIPERISNGDLDGDLYLVCWDKEVVDSMTRALPLVDQPAEDDGKLSTVPCDPEWFRKAQQIHLEKLRPEYNHLVGALYRLAEKIADKDESGRPLDHPDVRALFRAYNVALEYTKHGNPVCVPKHLIKELKEDLHPFVTPI